MVQPLNTLATWVLSIACVANVLHVVGYNVQPLLAAGGVSGIAIGFGAQKITQNLLAGITLVCTPPEPSPSLCAGILARLQPACSCLHVHQPGGNAVAERDGMSITTNTPLICVYFHLS